MLQELPSVRWIAPDRASCSVTVILPRWDTSTWYGPAPDGTPDADHWNLHAPASYVDPVTDPADTILPDAS